MKKILFLCLLLSPILSWSYKNYTFPRLLYKYNLLVEKFEPFNPKLISSSELESLSDEQRSDFLAFMNSYNKVYYKELNFIINNTLYYFPNANRFQTAHNDDISQSSTRLGATMPRFMLKNNLSHSKIIEMIKSDEKIDFLGSFDYWIYDLESKDNYKTHTNLIEFLYMINHYYYCADAGRWNIDRHQDFDRNVLKDYKKNVRVAKSYRRFSERTVGIIAGSAAVIMVTLGLIGNL